jgi:hypothetical protein
LKVASGDGDEDNIFVRVGNPRNAPSKATRAGNADMSGELRRVTPTGALSRPRESIGALDVTHDLAGEERKMGCVGHECISIEVQVGWDTITFSENSRLPSSR